MLLRAILVVAIALSLPYATASACMNPVALAGNKAIQRVKAAEKLLAQGKYRQAQKKVDVDEYHFRDPALQQRAELVYAVASLRGGGSVEYAIRKLGSMYEHDAESPVVQARLAEALLQGEEREHAVRAAELIEDLAARDLIPDANAWQTLATVRSDAGDDAGRDAALASCRKVSKKKNVCRVLPQG